MGFTMGIGRCIKCGRTISFNPYKVPSIRVGGWKKPVCLPCVAVMQQEQREAALPVWPDPPPGAYEPEPETEVEEA